MAGPVQVSASLNPHASSSSIMETPMVEIEHLSLWYGPKLAQDLPFDANAPFVHLERKFMHLGFHIYDVGFQSPNVDAARPMVFTTTLLLLGIVVLLNLFAIGMRNRLRRTYATSAV